MLIQADGIQKGERNQVLGGLQEHKNKKEAARKPPKEEAPS